MISVKTFRGTAPRYSARKLNHDASQIALNCDLFSGDLESMDNNIQVNIPTKTGVIQTIHKLGALWLHWNEIVDVARSPISTSLADRIYYSGHYNPKSTDEDLAASSGTGYPTDWYRLGLPSPDFPPTVGSTGGTAANSTRSYVITYVTEWGEEGPPTDASTSHTGPSDATWNLTNIDIAPINTGSITNIVIGGGVATFTVSARHKLETGDYIDITGIVGTGDLPGAFNDVGPLQVTRITDTTFSIPLSPSGSYTSGGTWTREAPINTTNMTKRIYRTVLGQYRFVAEIAAATTTYNDTLTDAQLGEALPSVEWISPPADMQGILTLPNGSLAGFKGNVLYMTPPYRPWAWPQAYEIDFAYEIVTIANSGNNIIVATVGNPYIVTGNDPETMTPLELEIYQSCVSKRSIVPILNGAIYASPDGLVYVPVSGTPEIITRGWYKRDDWQLLNPESMHCYRFDDRYYALYSGAGESGDESGLMVFDPAEVSSTVTTLSIEATAAHNQLEEDRLYFLEDGVIKEFGEGAKHITFQWRSKRFTLPRPAVMRAAQVKFTPGEGVLPSEVTSAIASAIAELEAAMWLPGGDPLTDEPVSSGALGGFSVGAHAVAAGPYYDAVWAILSTDTPEVTLKVRAKNIKIANRDDFTETIYPVQSSRPFRIKSGDHLSDIIEFEVTGSNVTVHEVNIAENKGELAGV